MASQQEIYQTLINVGANPEEARTLSAIAMAESGGDNNAYNPNGEDSVGWYQINLRAHGDRIDQAGASDPVRSSQYALQLYREQGGRPWSVFTNGSYQRYLGGGDPSMQEPTNNAEWWAQQQAGGGGMGPSPPPGWGGGSNVEVVPGPNGEPLLYIVKDASGIPIETYTPQQWNDLHQRGDPFYTENLPQGERPDWGSIIDAIYTRYETEVAAGRRPRDEAVEEFNRISGMIADRINIETTQGSFDQTASGQAITRATNMEDALRLREEARTNRGVSIQQERGRRASDAATQILPYAIPGRTSINLPLIGDMPLNNINLDQFYDIPGLNNIPQISPKLGVPFPQPANPQMTPFDPNAYPGLPPTPNVPTPDIRAILDQMLRGAYAA